MGALPASQLDREGTDSARPPVDEEALAGLQIGVWKRADQAVMPPTPSVAASSKLMLAGLGASVVAGATAYSA
jgi:hypothetical protein